MFAYMFHLVTLESLLFFTAAYMTGVIWFVQRVEYPLLPHAQGTGGAEAHREYTRRMGPVVGPVMVLELGLQLGQLGWRPGLLSGLLTALLLLIWISTFALQVPCHTKLSRAYDPATHQRLVRENWIRTVAWTLRSLLLMLIIIREAA